MPLNSVQAILVFVRVAESKSFSEGAKRLGMSPSGASRSIARLEESLGVRLVNRTTRSVSLTDEGRTFFESCRQILGSLEEAETAVARRQTKPRGRLHVVMPVGFGREVLVPLLARFVKLYPDIIVDAEFSNRVVDLADEGVDVVVRTGELRDTSLVARKLCDIRYIMVASPKYLERYGEPHTPYDLERHSCIGYRIPHANRYRAWNFTCEGKPVSRVISGSLNMSNGLAILNAAIAGAGVASLANFLACEAIKAGLLKTVMQECAPPPMPVWLGYLARRQLALRIRAFVDFLIKDTPQSSFWDLTPMATSLKNDMAMPAPDRRPAGGSIRRTGPGSRD